MTSAEIVTLLFTDLVGSTELLERLGDDQAETVRRRHFALLRDAVAARGGQEVKNLGDGLMAVFPSAVGALGCAVAIQEAVDAHNRNGEGPRFHVRVGLHAGEPAREEADYFGTAVVVAKRLCDAARGGQILASRLVSGLVGSRGAFRFRSVGRLRLKGLAEAVPAVEVVWGPAPEDVVRAGRPSDRGLGSPRRPASARSPRLVGRERELAALEAELNRAAQGFRCVLIVGEAGVGKTRLAGELLARHLGAGRALASRAFPLGETTSFGLWSDALEGYLSTLDVDQVAELCGGFLDDLAAVVHSVAAARGSAPEREPPRLRLLGGLAAVLANLASDGPLLVFLDDVHLADASSWEALRYLAQRLGDVPLLVVATARPAELDDQAAAEAVLLSLEQDGLLARMALAPLDADGVAALAETVLEEPPPPELSAWLAERSRGNALYAHGLLRALLEEGADLSAPRLQRLPENLADRVRARLRKLDRPAVELLEVLAVLGRRAGAGELTSVTEWTSDDIEATGAGLTRSRFVTEDEGPGGEPTYELGHPLVAEAIYQNLATSHRRRLHHDVARFLHASGQVAEAASHFVRSARVGDPETIAALRDALRQAEEREASREALTLIAALVVLLPSGDERWLEVADALSWEAEWVVDRRAGPHVAVALQALREIDSVLGRAHDPSRQARVRSRLASFLAYGTGDLDLAEATAADAVVLFEEADDRPGALRAALEFAFIRGWRGELACWEDGARAVVDAGERSLAMEATWHVGAAAMWRGRLDEAEAAFQHSLQLARQQKERYPIAFRLESLALMSAVSGRTDQAAARLDEVTSLYPRHPGGLVPEFRIVGSWHTGQFPAALGTPLTSLAKSPASIGKTRAVGWVFAALCAIEIDQPGAAREHLAKAKAVYAGDHFFAYLDYCRYAEGLLAWRDGRLPEGVATLGAVASRLVGMDARPWAAFVLVDLAELAALAGDQQVGHSASTDLAATATRIDSGHYRSLIGVGAAWAALASGEPAVARRAAEEALGSLSDSAPPMFVARVLHVLGRSLAGADRTAAVDALERAAALFEGCGARWRRERAVDSLRRLRGRGQKTAGALLGPGSLTPREREVARLAAEGLTAREIAKMLVLGQRTVEGHLANAYAKLGVRSKVELARRAGELGL